MGTYARMEYKSDYEVGLYHRDYTAIDIETTGLKPESDEIIELAAVRYRDGKEVDRFQSLVRPKGNISDFIENLTGINNAMVSDAPKIADILPSYLLFLGNDVLLGHNIKFDMGFIDEATESIGFDSPENKWNDTMLISRDVFKGERSHKLKDLCSRLNIPELQEHRALSDCIRTHLCYEAMREYCETNNVAYKKMKAPSDSPQKTDDPLEWSESKIKALNDNALFFYTKTYMDYAKSYISRAETMSEIKKIDPFKFSQEEIDATAERVDCIKKHIAFLNSEIDHRKANIASAPVGVARGPEIATEGPMVVMLSLGTLFLGGLVAVAGLAGLFLGRMLEGGLLFALGIVLLLVCYFKQ